MSSCADQGKPWHAGSLKGLGKVGVLATSRNAGSSAAVHCCHSRIPTTIPPLTVGAVAR